MSAGGSVRRTKLQQKPGTHHTVSKLTFVFCMTRCLGDRIKATREVEKSISIMAILPSSLLKMREKGSVW